MAASPINASHRLFVATAILKYVDAMAAQIDGVRKSKEIEYVHRMRVATRRVRNTIDLFESHLPSKRCKKWCKQVKRVARALGDARDVDVQIVAVREFLSTLDQAPHQAYRFGIERLLLRLTQRRSGLQRAVVAAIDTLESAGTVQEMQEVLRGFQAKGRAVDADALPASLQALAHKTIIRRFEEMMVFSPYVASSEHVDELHRMRIAAKLLRYTLEVYDPLLNESLKPQIKLIRHVQNMLGEIHDYDVWIHHLPIFLEEEEQRFRVFFGHAEGFSSIAHGILFFMDDRQACRHAVHQQLADFWKQATDTGQWNWLQAGFAASRPANIVITEKSKLPDTYNIKGLSSTKSKSEDG